MVKKRKEIDFSGTNFGNSGVLHLLRECTNCVCVCTPVLQQQPCRLKKDRIYGRNLINDNGDNNNKMYIKRNENERKEN